MDVSWMINDDVRMILWNWIFFVIFLDNIIIIVIYIIIKDFFNFVEYVVVIDVSWIIMIEDML